MAEAEEIRETTKKITIIVHSLHQASQLVPGRKNITMLNPHCHDLQRRFGIIVYYD